MVNENTGNYDLTWKEALGVYFPQFLAFFFPQVSRLIDWSIPVQSLDKELQQITASFGSKKEADKLFQAKLLEGEETWILVHVEVQTKEKSDFAKRMYIYNYRAFDLYERQVISLAILGDKRNNWRPNSYGYALGGCEISLKFPIVKLVDYLPREPELLNNSNPFAIIALAHLKTLTTNNQLDQRQENKWNLVRALYAKGYQKPQLVKLFQLIDEMMTLPVALQQSFEKKLASYQEERIMPILSNMEKRGALANAHESVNTVLRLRFGEVPSELVALINSQDNLFKLKKLLETAVVTNSLEEFEQFFNSEEFQLLEEDEDY